VYVLKFFSIAEPDVFNRNTKSCILVNTIFVDSLYALANVSV
jgi:hypothetical protein